jgi:hypothetical protein
MREPIVSVEDMMCDRRQRLMSDALRERERERESERELSAMAACFSLVKFRQKAKCLKIK